MMTGVSTLLTLPPERPLRVVLDTNVVMALWHFCDTRLLILKQWVESDAVCLLSDAVCLCELERVLAYRQFAIAPERQTELLAEYQKRTHPQPPAEAAQEEALTKLPRCGDRDDQKFIELAARAQARLLVSRDKLVLKLARRRELRDQLLIMTPERLQHLLESA